MTESVRNRPGSGLVQQALRLEHAERLIERGEPVEAAAHSVGFADARMLRRLHARA